MTDLITADLVRLDADLGADKHDVIRSLAGMVADAGRSADPDQLAADAIAREGDRRHRAARRHRDPPLPHDRRRGADARPSPGSRPKVEFGAKDGPADLVFLIAAPAGGDATHLQLLTKLARALVKKDFTDAPARRQRRPSEVVALVLERRRLTPPRGAAHAARPRPPAGRRPRPARRSPGRGHRVPDRHRPHLHGGRGPRGRRRQGRRTDRRRDPGLRGLQAPAARDDRRRDGGDLRRRRGRPRPRPVRRQAGGLVEREAPDRRRRRDDRRGPALRRRPERTARRGRASPPARAPAAVPASRGARAPAAC